MDVSAVAIGPLLKLAIDRVECLVRRCVCVVVDAMIVQRRVVIHDELGATQADVDAHAKGIAVAVVVTGELDRDVARDDLVTQGFELLYTLPNVCAERVRVHHAAKRNLERSFHEGVIQFACGVPAIWQVDCSIEGEVQMKQPKPTQPQATHVRVAKTSHATKEKEKVDGHGCVHRRDATGHLDPAYAAGLLAITHEIETTRAPNSAAFLQGMYSSDPLAEDMGEDFVRTALSGEDDAQDDVQVVEEIGGPFVVTTGQTEFASGTDASNPPGATCEPFPKA